MSVERQRLLILSELTEIAKSVDIDYSKSEFALMEAASRLTGTDQLIFENPVDAERCGKEADQLLEKFGQSEAGKIMLIALAEASTFANCDTFIYREHEGGYNHPKEQGWNSVKERALCDFAMFTGMAYSACSDYLTSISASAGTQSAYSLLGKLGAEKRHASPNGSREKRRQIRLIWATGKYSSRDVCAEQECAALGMSFSTARKALRGTLAPNDKAFGRDTCAKKY